MAALRNFARVFERFGNIGKQRRHLGARFEILRGCEITGAPFITQHLATRNAHPRFMRFEIIRRHELNRMRCHHRQIAHTGQIHGGRIVRLIEIALSALQLNIKRIRKIMVPAICQRHRALGIGLHQGMANIAKRRSR